MTNYKRQTYDLPIGVFDSGMGGLTVLRQLKLQLPNESFLYLGDTARLPYGTKSQDTVIAYAKQMAQSLVDKGIKLLVIACNTATTAALPVLQQLLPQLPIIGVIEPGAKAASQASKNERVLVLATETTVRSGVYNKAILANAPAFEVKEQACGLFVALAEEGCVDDAVCQAVIEKYIPRRLEQDCILLGCTHFPVFKATIQAHVGKHVAIVDSAVETTKAVKQVLDNQKLHRLAVDKPTITYLVTDLPERFMRIAPTFLGEGLSESQVEVI